MFNKPASGHSYTITIGQFVEQKILLSCSFGCEHFHIEHCYNIGHSLLCCLSLT